MWRLLTAVATVLGVATSFGSVTVKVTNASASTTIGVYLGTACPSSGTFATLNSSLTAGSSVGPYTSGHSDPVCVLIFDACSATYEGCAVITPGDEQDYTWTGNCTPGSGVLTNSTPPAPCILCFDLVNDQAFPVTFGIKMDGNWDGMTAIGIPANYQEIWSPLIAPNATWHQCMTNSSGGSFNATPEQVIWGGDGEPYLGQISRAYNCGETGLAPIYTGPGTVTIPSPVPPTNSPPGGPPGSVTPSTNYPAPPSSGGPAPPGSGQGSTTNVTGGQYATGIGGVISTLQGIGSLIGQGIGTIVGAIHGQGTNSTGSGDSGTNVVVVDSYGKTNGWRGDYTNSMSQATNAASASNLAAVVWGPVLAGSSNALVLVGSESSMTNTGTGDGSALQFEFMGAVRSIDPNDIFGAGILNLIRSLIGWGATIGFLFWFCQRHSELVRMAGTTQLGGVPDLVADVLGTGGNVLGALTALVVPLVYLGIWVFVFTELFALGLGVTGSAYFAINPFTQLGTYSGGQSAAAHGALYVLNLLLPLPYLLSLAWTRIVLWLTTSHFVSLCVATSRFLWGK